MSGAQAVGRPAQVVTAVPSDRRTVAFWGPANGSYPGAARKEMILEKNYPGDAIWERLALECGPISDSRGLDDATLAAAIRERRVVRIDNTSDGYAGRYLWMTVVSDPAVDLAQLRCGGAHLSWWWTVVFARPLAVADEELRILGNRVAGVSWERFGEVPHLPTK